MPRHGTGLPIGLATLVLLVMPTSAAAIPPGFEAHLAGEGIARQIVPECFLHRGTLRCAIYGGRVPARAKCSFGGAVASVALRRRRPARRGVVCVDEGFHDWTVLRPGKRWTRGAFSCVHRQAGSGTGRHSRLRCRNAAGHKFTVDGYGRTRLTTATSARRRIPHLVVATPHNGIRRIAGLRIGDLFAPGAVPTLRDVRRKLGRPLSIRRPVPETCEVRWRSGLEMAFVTFGSPGRCAVRSLQTATLTGPGWRVRVGKRTYRIGTRRARLPRRAKRYGTWGGGGYALASMPFVGTRTATVLAHVSNGRVDRFFIFVGGAGD